jgi:hypothetical protein
MDNRKDISLSYDIINLSSGIFIEYKAEWKIL